MRVASNEQFNKFLIDNPVYPYTKLRPTRNSFFCEWVVLSATGSGIMGTQTDTFPVPASCFSARALQQLIMEEKALPLPPIMSEIMDGMFVWGQSKSYAWFVEVVELLTDAMIARLDEDRKHLMLVCISPAVKAEIARNTNNDVVADLLWIEWVQFFNTEYDDKESFYCLAVSSYAHVSWAIAQVNYHAM